MSWWKNLFGYSDDNTKKITLSGKSAETPEAGTPTLKKDKNAQYEDYWVLSEEERKKGFVNPYCDSYIHLKCGAVTRMAVPIAETYARDPKFYGSTYCSSCKDHFPVGEEGEFVWDNKSQKKVGS